MKKIIFVTTLAILLLVSVQLQSALKSVTQIIPLIPVSSPGLISDQIPASSRGSTSTQAPASSRGNQVVPASSRVYVVVFSTSGQQGSGIRALSALQCFLSSIDRDFRYYILEPQIQNSSIGIRDSDVPSFNFSSFFDVDHFNAQSRRIGYPEMITREEFTDFSPEQAVYIVFQPCTHCPNVSSPEIAWNAKKVGKEVRCFEERDARLLKMLRRGEQRELQEFSHSAVFRQKCIVRIVRLQAARFYITWNQTRWRYAVEKVRDSIFGEWSSNEVTLMFSQWSARMHAPVDTPLNGIDCITQYEKGEQKEQFQPSKRLLRDAKRYEDTFLGGRNKLTIMLRAERVVGWYLKEPET